MEFVFSSVQMCKLMQKYTKWVKVLMDCCAYLTALRSASHLLQHPRAVQPTMLFAHPQDLGIHVVPLCLMPGCK